MKLKNFFKNLNKNFVNISFKDMDEVIKEIIFQEISTKKYSFSDSKTVSLTSWSIITGILLKGLILINSGLNCSPLEISILVNLYS